MIDNSAHSRDRVGGVVKAFYALRLYDIQTLQLSHLLRALDRRPRTLAMVIKMKDTRQLVPR